jgi:Tol biopolymer transport system component
MGRIVYVSNYAGNNDIYTISIDGTGEQQLTNSPADEYDPAWSPDGSKIAFVRNDGGNRDIWVMNPDGSGQLRLTGSSASDRYPSWSPDGKAIAFRSNRSPSTSFDIWKMAADGSGAVRVTADAGMWGSSLETTPRWSPDGRALAFVSDRDGNHEIYVTAADGSNPRQMTNNPASDQFPTWSPDGTQITFGTNRDGNEEIYSMRAGDGSGATNLTANPATDRYPAWSPDGTKIAFRSSRAHGFDIFLMNPDGSEPTQLTFGLGRTMQPGFEGFGIFMPGGGSGPAGGSGQTGGSTNGGANNGGSQNGSGGSGRSGLKVRIKGATRQRIVRQRGVVVVIRCSAACPFRLTGSLKIAGSKERIPLTGVKGKLAAGKRKLVKLALKPKRLKRAAQLLAARKRVRAVVSFRAGTPAAGTSSASTVVRCRR